MKMYKTLISFQSKLVLFLQAYLVFTVRCHDAEGQGPCQSAKCILSQLHSEKMQFYAKAESGICKFFFYFPLKSLTLFFLLHENVMFLKVTNTYIST